MDDTLNLLLDVIIIVLLVPTIVYAVILNTRLKQLRDNRDDLARLVAAFNDATARAESGIPKLRRAADEAGQSLQERVEKAQTLRDDLAFMTERADSMAGRLESTVRQAREEVRPAAPPPAAAPAVAPARAPRTRQPPQQPVEPPEPELSDAADDERSEAERELLRALQAVR
jgi:chromosome segregation ATPase